MVQLSIIIPVYNVDQWLSRCLDSLLNQDLSVEEYELIVVNDGSQDNSLNIAEEYASTHKNIKIVSRENGGLSAARNTGLELACGQYVWFIDSDDWIQPNVLGHLSSLCIEKNLDILCFGLYLRYEDNTTEKYNIGDKSGGVILSGQDFVTSVNMPPAAWCAIYRRKYLIENDLKFYEGIFHEDQEFTPRAYLLSKRIMYYPHDIYNYFQRSGSIMKSTNYRRKADSLIAIADSLNTFKNKNAFKDKALKWLINHIYFVYCQSLGYAAKSNLPLGVYKEKAYYPLKLSMATNYTERLKYLIINISPALFGFIYRLK